MAVSTDYPEKFSSKVVRARRLRLRVGSGERRATLGRELMLVAPKRA